MYKGVSGHQTGQLSYPPQSTDPAPTERTPVLPSPPPYTEEPEEPPPSYNSVLKMPPPSYREVQPEARHLSDYCCCALKVAITPLVFVIGTGFGAIVGLIGGFCLGFCSTFQNCTDDQDTFCGFLICLPCCIGIGIIRGAVYSCVVAVAGTLCGGYQLCYALWHPEEVQERINRRLQEQQNRW